MSHAGIKTAVLGFSYRRSQCMWFSDRGVERKVAKTVDLKVAKTVDLKVEHHGISV